jgi:hypothetical protein
MRDKQLALRGEAEVRDPLQALVKEEQHAG